MSAFEVEFSTTPKFTTYENQKVVVVHREQVEENFILIKKENMYQAYQTVKASATCLWLYLIGNQDGYKFALSPTAIAQSLGMNDKTYYRSIKRLIDAGYLVQRREGSNIYDVYERPYSEIQADKKSESLSPKMGSEAPNWESFPIF